MNGNNYLIDTNIVIGLFANVSLILERIKSHSGKIFIPSTVIGELFYGAEQSSKKESNKKRVEDFAQSSLIKDCDLGTARHYAILKSQLKSKGTPIPENDLWIASLAQQHGLTLVTRDKHFNKIESLQLENW
jgi:tRNA(fMet)-specific endonuclease VapC